MNKFRDIAKSLIANPLWTNTVTVSQMVEKRTGTKPEYVVAMAKDVHCVVKDVTKTLDNNRSLFLTEFIIPASDLDDFTNLDKSMITLTYNGKKYNVYDVNRVGNINNEPTVIKMQVKR